MKLIVGLGNPGKSYENTPHNAGFMAVDSLRVELETKGLTVHSWQEVKKEKSLVSEVFTSEGSRVAVLVKPQTFMNLSGGAVQQIMRKYGMKNPEDVLIVYDELDIELGSFKYSPIRNSRTHRGISSVISSVGATVHSLRIGVEHRQNVPIPGMDYVLKPYSQRELASLNDAISKGIAQHVLPFLGLV